MNTRARGFTLVEVLTVLGMIAVLCAITLPSYATHLKKGRARTAALELAALSLAMEGRLQQQSSYPVLAEGTEATPALFPGWRPVMGEHFLYSVRSTESTYQLQAVGRAGLRDCVLTLDHAGRRTVSPGCGFSSWT